MDLLDIVEKNRIWADVQEDLVHGYHVALAAVVQVGGEGVVQSIAQGVEQYITDAQNGAINVLHHILFGNAHPNQVGTNHHQDSRLDGEDNSVPLVLR